MGLSVQQLVETLKEKERGKEEPSVVPATSSMPPPLLHHHLPQPHWQRSSTSQRLVNVPGQHSLYSLFHHVQHRHSLLPLHRCSLLPHVLRQYSLLQHLVILHWRAPWTTGADLERRVEKHRNPPAVPSQSSRVPTSSCRFRRRSQQEVALSRGRQTQQSREEPSPSWLKSSVRFKTKDKRELIWEGSPRTSKPHIELSRQNRRLARRPHHHPPRHAATTKLRKRSKRWLTRLQEASVRK